MRAVKLLVEPFDFLNITEVESKKAINCHGEIRLTGLISQNKEKEYLRRAEEEETWVTVKAVSEKGEEKRFFDGVLTGLRIKKENQVSYLTLELKTGSYLLDLKPHIRSFQQEGVHYADIIQTCIKEAGGNCIILEKAEAVSQKMLFQYHETDWEFFRRISSYAGAVLIPEYTVPGKNIYFGYPKEQMPELSVSDSYEMFRGCKQLRVQNAAETWRTDQQNKISYRILSREIYTLGNSIKFQGEDFVIGEIRSWLKGQELYHEYHLISPEAGLLPVKYNEELTGASLKAYVTAVDKTVIQVQIQEDENKKNCGSRWFDYATVYSTPDGTGWYCMPEAGDTVRIVFPDREESNAYTVSAVHVGTIGGRSNPDEKSWKNKQNKEILFTPDFLCLKNNKGLLVELSDQNGIKIASNKGITIQSAGDLKIKSAEAGVQVSAASQILMQQGAAKIQMEDAIYISGGKIYMN